MLAIASDHGGFALKQEIKAYMDELKIEHKDFGCFDTESCDYPDLGVLAAKAVANGTCERGILICGTGAGMCYTANKIKGIRCVLCSEPYTAEMSRRHNDANMLALGGRVVGADLAKMIVRIWLETPFEGGRHQRRIDKIAALES
ncbi:MAG: ribose 5-phosphate isomerase B [Termitinemataceae bacterium]|nr:MAG: ribose 5-phosphate isomerase B [Termitinemataceae bacterium]